MFVFVYLCLIKKLWYRSVTWWLSCNSLISMKCYGSFPSNFFCLFWFYVYLFALVNAKRGRKNISILHCISICSVEYIALALHHTIIYIFLYVYIYLMMMIWIDTSFSVKKLLGWLRKASLYSQDSDPPNALNGKFKFHIIKAKKGEIVRDRGRNMKT